MDWKQRYNTPKVGMRVKLKDYSEHIDYRKHTGETGEITEISESTGLPITITWNDGDRSCIKINNVLITPS